MTARTGGAPTTPTDTLHGDLQTLACVVHVVFGGRYLDGREVVVAELAGEQRRHLLSPIVLVGLGPRPMHERLSRRAGTYRPMQPGQRGFGWLAALCEISRLVSMDGGRCLLHAHGLRALALVTLVQRVLGCGSRPIIVYTAHGFGGTCRQRSVKASLERILCRDVDRVIACSPVLVPRLAGVSRAPIDVVLNGVRQNAFSTPTDRAQARLRLCVRDEYPVIGIVGRLAPEKRHDVFLAAGRHLVRRFPAAQLLIAGDGPDRVELTRLARTYGLESQVRFLGHVDDVSLVYQAIDLLLHSSDVEGTPLAVVEAMTAGVPVVATAVGGLPALVEHGVTGLLVPRRQPRLLAEAATRILTDESLRKSIERTLRQRAEETSSLTRMCLQVNNAYRAAVGG